MLTAVQFDKSNEQTVNNRFALRYPEFKWFCRGSKEVIAESLKEKCHNCQKSITSDDTTDKEKLWILFIPNKKNDGFLVNLLDICSVQKFEDASKFFDSVKVHCRVCLRRASGQRSRSVESSGSVVEIKPEPVNKALETNTASNLDSRVDSAGPTSSLENQTIGREAIESKPLFQAHPFEAPRVAITREEELVKLETDNQMVGESHLANNSASTVTERAMEMLGSEAVRTETKLFNTGEPTNNLLSTNIDIANVKIECDQVSTQNDFNGSNIEERVAMDFSSETSKSFESESSGLDWDDSDLIPLSDLQERFGLNTCSRRNQTSESEPSGSNDKKKNAVYPTNSSVKKVGFKCSECLKKLQSKKNFVIHMRTHTGKNKKTVEPVKDVKK